ncbi:MAG: ABC transporter permease, partial [Tannerella sp.]|nr:ABC transporter permease [Tannerella sp.]
GLFWGNIIGISVCLLQSYFKWFGLDPEIYYMDSVPVEISVFSLLLINTGSLAVSMFMMIAPSFLITKIEPAKSIRFE